MTIIKAIESIDNAITRSRDYLERATFANDAVLTEASGKAQEIPALITLDYLERLSVCLSDLTEISRELEKTMKAGGKRD